MKKISTIYAVIILALIVLFIVPPLGVRIDEENKHRGYVVSVTLQSICEAFEYDDALSVVEDYKKSGATAVVVSDISDTYETELKLAKESKMDIALKIAAGIEKPDGYMSNLEQNIESLGIKYIVIREHKDETGYKLNLEKLIEKHNLTVIVNENTNQLSNIMPEGYDDYLQAANHKLMRGFETMPEPSRTISNPEDATEDTEFIYYHMMNSIIDRNIKFMMVNQLDDGFGNSFDRARRTQNSIRKFCNSISNFGYSGNLEPDFSDYNVDRTLTSASVAAISVLMCGIILLIILNIRNKALHYAIMILAAAAFGLTFVLPQSLILLYPTVYAPLASCFCFSLCLAVTDRLKTKNYFWHIVFVTLSAFLSLCICSTVLGALVAGYDYHINNLVFRGVKLGLLIPIAFAFLSAPVRMNGGIEGLRQINIKSAKNLVHKYIKKIRPIHIIFALIILSVCGLYILRSGNTKITIAENLSRNTIAVITGARPRTKEFLICWPCLALFAFYAKYNQNKILTWITATGSSVLFASVMNTFCHVFADFQTSFLRTVYGLGFSVPITVAVIILNVILLKILKIYKNKTQKDG